MEMERKELIKIVAPCHYHILDAFLDGCEVYYLSDNNWIKLDNFIKSYGTSTDSNHVFVAIPKSLENCYCEATTDNCEHMVAYGYEYTELHEGDPLEEMSVDVTGTFILFSTTPSWRFETHREILLRYKQIEYNTQLQNWVYCPKDTEVETERCTCTDSMGVNNTTGKCLSCGKQEPSAWEPDTFTCKGSTKMCRPVKEYKGPICRGSWSLGNNCKTCERCIDTKPKENEDETDKRVGGRTSEKEEVSVLWAEPINNFEKFGFTADFHGRIYEEKDGWLFGVIYKFKTLGADGQTYLEDVACQWYSRTGEVMHTSKTEEIYNLTPIVPEPTYPLFKKNCLGEVFRLDDDKAHGEWLLTSPKADTLDIDERYVWVETVPCDSERGLYHGQPVFYYTPYGTAVHFWNAVTSKSCDKEGDPGSTEDVTIEPVPLEVLKLLPWIWEQYQAFIKDK